MWLTFSKLVIVTVLTQQTFSFECRKREPNLVFNYRHGQPTSHGDWPWHVTVYHTNGSSFEEYACGGTLISERFVLTAVHCVRGENEAVLSNRKIFIRLGLHKLDDLDPRTCQQHNVHQIYEYNHQDGRKNDISIIELATEAKFTDYVQPAYLNQVEDLTGQFGTAIGWGIDETDKLSTVLIGQKMPVVSTMQCIESDVDLRNALDSSLFCAGYTNGSTVCNGDSGGGLHFERNGVWYVGGIVSFTIPRDSSNLCHLNSYAGFTNVHYFLPWIRSVTGLGNKDPYQTLLPQDCGRYLTNRVYGGTRADLYEFPWVVRLVYKEAGKLIRGCHGSLISKRYVLTNANCASDEKHQATLVEMGEYDQSKKIDCDVNNVDDCAPPVRRVAIQSITIHPDYYSHSEWNNIALIRLKRDIKFEDHIQPICLPVTQSLRQHNFEQGIVAGWGILKVGGNHPAILQKATVYTIDKVICGYMLYLDVGDDVFCTGGSTAAPNTCKSDTGTPLGYPSLYDGRVRFVQYGISAIVGCDYGVSTHTSVANHVDWILDNLSA